MADRPLDVRLVIDAADGRPGLPVDTHRVGLSGHSFGGWTALHGVADEPRVAAVVALAPAAGLPHLRAVLDLGWTRPVPTMIVAADGDSVLPLAGSATPTWQHCLDFAIDAAREACAQAGLAGIGPGRIALVMGSSLGHPEAPIYRMTEQLGDALGVAGPRLTVTTACSSSTNALGLALDLLRTGAADVVIAGGADVLTPLVLAGFTALGVLTPDKRAPFSEPAGTTLGEGAGFLVLERRADARARGATAAFAVLGYGLSADGFHDTGPDPTGAGVARAIRAALDHAGVTPDQVDYVNAHGTGTRANDPAEWRALQPVFGRRAEALPIRASKSFLGHAQGSAGVLETIATLVALERGAIPATQRFTVPRPNSPPDAVGQDTPRPARCDRAVCTNSAFGGANCAIVIGRADHADPTAPRRPVFLAGLGAIGPHGIGLDRLRTTEVRGRVAGFRIEDVMPSVDPRGLDPCTCYLTGVAALALADAGVRVRGDARDRTGLVVGVTVPSPQVEAALNRTIEEHGYRGLSANRFSRMVLNAPAGTCAKLHGLRGAHSTVSAGPASGLFAIAYAAELLASGGDCDRVLAAGLDELPPGPVVDGASEGAAAVLLASAPGRIRVAGWSLAGPGQLAAAATTAMAMAGLTAIDRVVGERPAGIDAADQLDPVAADCTLRSRSGGRSGRGGSRRCRR